MEQAKIINREIRCPICGRKHGELHGGESIVNLRVRCKGSKETKQHEFIINYNSRDAESEM